jgi:hypothetical protein
MQVGVDPRRSTDALARALPFHRERRKYQRFTYPVAVPMDPKATRLVFLCYSRRDRGIVRKCQAVIRAAGMVPWRDEDSIAPGAKWRLSIATAIDSCERVLVFWCRHASASDEVRAEYWAGIRAGKVISPIRLDATALPDPLKSYQATDMPGWSRLIHVLLTIEWWLWISSASLLLAALLAYTAT